MRSFFESLALAVGAACSVASCSPNTSGLKHTPDGDVGGYTAIAAGGAGGGLGMGGIVASGGATGMGGATAKPDAAGRSGGTSIADAAAGSGGSSGGKTSTGGAGGSGAGGITSTGGGGGTTTSCPLVRPCNWCGGSRITDSAGCVIGFRCANGADPCAVDPCSTTSPCPTGYTCGADRLCWPGTGGAGGGAGGTAGTGGRTGTGGTGGSVTTCPGVAACNWCMGDPVLDSAGCIIGWRCANGADPCTTQPCTADSDCQSGYTCKDQLCWPSSTGGAGGGGGHGGAGGAGGTVGTSQRGVRCLRALCNTGQVCCVDEMSVTLTCTSPEDCAGIGGFAVSCDGPEDCTAGQQCCMSSGVPLQPSCTSGGGCLAGLVMCHSSADCAAGQNCCATTQFGYDHGLCTTGACP